MASLREVIEKAKSLVAQSEKNEVWYKRCKSSGSHEKVKRQSHPELKTNSHTDQTSIDSKDDDKFEIATKLIQQVSKWQKAQLLEGTERA